MYKIDKNREFNFTQEINLISLRRILISSFLTALMATIISFLSVKLNYFPNSPIVLFIPFIASIIGIFVYFRLFYRNEINMITRESIIFGFISAIFWTLFTSILGTTIFVGVYNYSWSTSSILPSLLFGFIIFTCGAFFCSIILPPIGLSLGKMPPTPPLKVPSIKKRKLLSIIVFVVILVIPVLIFPTPHIRSVSGIMQSFPFGGQYMGLKIPFFLFGGQSSTSDISTYRSRETIGPMIFRTVLDVQSTEDLSIEIAIEESYSTGTGKPTNSRIYVGYNATAKVHKSSFQQTITGENAMIRYKVTTKNPAPLAFTGGIFPNLNWEAFLKNGTITFSFPSNITMPTPLIANGTINVYKEYQYMEWMEWWGP